MRANDWPAGHADHVEAGPLAGVAAGIDQDTQILHLINHILARNAQRRRRVK